MYCLESNIQQLKCKSSIPDGMNNRYTQKSMEPAAYTLRQPQVAAFYSKCMVLDSSKSLTGASRCNPPEFCFHDKTRNYSAASISVISPVVSCLQCTPPGVSTPSRLCPLSPCIAKMVHVSRRALATILQVRMHAALHSLIAFAVDAERCEC